MLYPTELPEHALKIPEGKEYIKLGSLWKNGRRMYTERGMNTRLKQKKLAFQDGDFLQCEVCHHECRLPLHTAGFCGVRRHVPGENGEGRIVEERYGLPAAIHLDPIEKKPLYHVAPGSMVYSMGTYGCTMRCRWCQNSELLFPRKTLGFHNSKENYVEPEQAANAAKDSGAWGIAFTYNEPTVWIEYARDVAVAAREQGLKSIWVSNGYFSAKAREFILPWIDAINIDLKAFSPDIHTKYTGVDVYPVLETIQEVFRAGIWLEISMLIVPGINDDDAQLKGAAAFLVSLSPDIPVHISAFYPAHRMLNVPPTPVVTIQRAVKIFRAAGLRYVYPGNVGIRATTVCPNCGNACIERENTKISGFGGICSQCGNEIPGIW